MRPDSAPEQAVIDASFGVGFTIDAVVEESAQIVLKVLENQLLALD